MNRTEPNISTESVVTTPLGEVSTDSTLKTATPAQLIEALGEAATKEQAHAEIQRRIDSNVATKLAARYLLPSSESEREEVFDGLVGLCWKAKQNLSLYPTQSEKAQGHTEYSLTREFIENRVLDELDRYHGESEEVVLRAALDKFRYIGLRLHSRLTDEIRKRSSAKNQEPRRTSSDGLLERGQAANVLPTADFDSTLSDAIRPRYTNSSTPLEFVQARRDRLTTSLGEAQYESLEAITEEFPQAFQGNEQQTKSALTRAIQRKRRVSEQAASGNKRDLTAKASEEMQRGNRDLCDFQKLVAHGEDENTLRQEFISGDGHRRRVIVIRIKKSSR